MRKPTAKRLCGLAALFAALLASACILQFENGMFQTMTLHFSLSEELPQAESTLVHSIHYPHEVQVRRKWVRISGALMPPAGAAAPDEIRIASRFEDAETARLAGNLKANAKIAADGSFSVRSRIKKNVAADTLQLITAEPRGADLPAGTKIWLCIDIVNKKKDLASLPDCPAASDGGGGGGSAEVSVIQVRDNDFEPKRVRVEPGDTVRWELTGLSLNHTVTAMDESVFDSGFLSSAGAFFEITFNESHRDQTFEYFCRTHRTCCEMQGSVQVGANAPDPGDGY